MQVAPAFDGVHVVSCAQPAPFMTSHSNVAPALKQDGGGYTHAPDRH
jgi:hypothetical protein